MKSVLWFCTRVILSVFLVHSAVAQSSCSRTLTLEFKNDPHINAFVLPNPTRLVVDFAHTDQVLTPLDSFVDHQCIKQARINLHYNQGVRAVYDMALPIQVTSQVGKNAAHFNATLHITESGKPKAVEKKAPTKPPIPVTPLRDIVVVIDPGHGGVDPGAIAVTGAREKNIALQIAKRLASKLNAMDGIKAYLTRNNDTFIELRKRTEYAQKKQADLFISIHADSHPNGRAHGVSVYALSESGATSEAARILADKENTLYDGKDKHAHHGFVLESVLIDLQQVSTVHQSLYLGKMILKHVALIANRHSRHVEQAAFVVLKSPTIPSVLIETGFLSNKKEATKLSSKVYQEHLAYGFAKAVQDYFIAHRVENTFFDVAQNHQTIQVVTGDTLAKIAGKYGVRIQDIQQLNHLHSHHIHVGQKLWLPRKKI
jgi:N-acetylmuramoyl-L-alanine amidase